MAIETRHGKRYFYRKKRIGKKVVSEYVGGSEFDLMLAEWKEHELMIERWEKVKREIEREGFEKVDRKLDNLESEINKIVAAHLTASGFYKTSSREWRYKQSD